MSNRKHPNKSAARRKKKRLSIAQKVSITVLSLFTAVFVIMNLIPDLKPVTDSAGFAVYFRLLFSAWVLYFAFIHTSAAKYTWEAKTAMVLGALIVWLGVLPERLMLIADVFIVFAQCLLITVSHIRDPGSAGPELLLCFSFITLILDQRSTVFLRHPNGIHFWIFSLVISVVVGAACVVLLRRGILKLKDNRLIERICLVLLVTVFMFFTVSYSLCSLNRALDDSEPLTYQALITDRRIETSKSGSDYYLDLELPAGTYSMSVYESDYQALEIGDTIEIQYYQGAFGEPYFCLEPQD